MSTIDVSHLMECCCKLHEAILEGDLETTKNLLQLKSCNVNETDERHGRTALHLAAMRGRADLVNVLLEGGADVSATDKLGNTPLHWCGHPETVELLVEHGASVLQGNKRGLTPRDFAERRGVTESVYSLLCQLEVEHSDIGNPSRSHSIPTRSSMGQQSKKSKTINSQPLSGLWQECASELGSRNFVLLVLGLLALSLYVAYILTGLHHASHSRIPIDVH